MTIADILDRAADLIEPEGKWTQGELARGKSGKPVRTRRAATCFCIMGAINAASGEIDRPLSDEFVSVLTPLLPTHDPIWIWNDAPERTQPEAVAKLREAANVARERGL